MRLVLLLACACGGQIQGGDGGAIDGGADVTVGCSIAGGVVTMGKDTCQIEEAWQCGATAYAVTCSCLAGSPNGTCTCAEMTDAVGSGTTVAAPAGVCPPCMANPAAMAQVCGFPR